MLNKTRATDASSKAPGEDCGEGDGGPPEEKKCDYCGGCYNRDGRHTVECVHGYDAKCWAWYAPSSPCGN